MFIMGLLSYVDLNTVLYCVNYSSRTFDGNVDGIC